MVYKGFEPPRLCERQMRKNRLVGCGVGRFRILAQKVVEKSGSASPEADDEYRRSFQPVVSDTLLPDHPFGEVEHFEDGRNSPCEYELLPVAWFNGMLC
jgi:hypothetical protein